MIASQAMTLREQFYLFLDFMLDMCWTQVTLLVAVSVLEGLNTAVNLSFNEM